VVRRLNLKFLFGIFLSIPATVLYAPRSMGDVVVGIMPGFRRVQRPKLLPPSSRVQSLSPDASVSKRTRRDTLISKPFAPESYDGLSPEKFLKGKIGRVELKCMVGSSINKLYNDWSQNRRKFVIDSLVSVYSRKGALASSKEVRSIVAMLKKPGYDNPKYVHDAVWLYKQLVLEATAATARGPVEIVA